MSFKWHKKTTTHRLVQNLIKFLFQFAWGENVFYTITFYIEWYQDTKYKPSPSFPMTKDSHLAKVTSSSQQHQVHKSIKTLKLNGFKREVADILMMLTTIDLLVGEKNQHFLTKQ